VLRALAKFFKTAFYSLLILLGVIFAVGNRGRIDLTFFPLPYTLSMPLFLFAFIVFAAGALLGWMITHVGTVQYRRGHKQSTKRVAALENELGAVRSEQMMQQATPALR